MKNAILMLITGLGILLVTSANIFAEDLPISGYTGGASEISFPAWTSNTSYPVVLTAPGRDGYEVCALGLGSKWPGRGSNLKNIDKSRALGCGVVQNGKVTLTIPVDKDADYVEAVNWMEEMPNHDRDWFPHPGIGDLEGNGDGPYVFRNANNSPLTAWVVSVKDRRISVYERRDAFRDKK